MMAIARIGTYRLPNRLLSSAKIRLSRGQKQIYLCFAEAEYLRRSQRLGLSRGQKQIYLYFAEAEYLRRSQRLGSSRDFICILPKRDGVKDTESREKTGTCSQVSEAHSIFYKDRERKSNCAGSHVKISGPKSYPSPSKYNPRQNKIGLFDRGVISRCAA